MIHTLKQSKLLFVKEALFLCETIQLNTVDTPISWVLILRQIILFSVLALANFVFFLYLVAYLSTYHEKAIKPLQRTRLAVAGHLPATLKWGNPAKCLSQQHNK